ncbi:hypothetical protein HHK36_002385 [Tetracentron sinense]|uniref:Mitochondrial glycoprotein n=1 Tax=Tetracentron sinense TaxID=13715 RepID=A0A834ZWB3_TETSI|nr:hypothetical protein HHK36_002385 [Tetracentron sinense]
MSSLLRKTLSFSRVSLLIPKHRHSLLYSSMASSSSSSSSSSSLLGKLSQNPSRQSSLFSSSALKHKVGSDENLKRVLDSEIQCAEESDHRDQGGVLPNEFPFEIIDNPGEQTILLKREFAGESIQVEVHMPDMAGEEDEDNEDDDDGDESNENLGQPNVSLIVTIAKGEGPRMEFCCTAYPDDITIDSMLMKGHEVSSDQIAYEGPEFSDLDESLQKGMYKYLEVRGIKSNLTNFLQEYMINKDEREYLGWLKNMKEFIGK